MKSLFSVITLIIFLSIISCSPAKNDSSQTPRQPVFPQNQEEMNPAPTENSVDENLETTSQSNALENNTQLTINPPHGQPGHRCDIPVGAPLNSQPANNTKQQITNNPSTNSATNPANNPMAPTIENAKRLNSSQSQSSVTTQNSGRINPPHGQPGHRCDIPVGSPLP